MKIGIDALAYYVPQQYLPIESLAEARNIEYAKLNKGLGLTSMSFPDVDEDAATMGANAVLNLFTTEPCAELLTENFGVEKLDILILCIIDLPELGGSKLIINQGYKIQTLVSY